MIIVTYTLLVLAICAVWLPSIPISAQRNLPPWLILFLGSVACGIVAGVITLIGLGSLAGFALVTWLATRVGTARWHSVVLGLLTLVVALALATHRLPGFHNPVLLADVKFAFDSAPFTLYANFDKAAVGLLLLALCCRRVSSRAELAETMRKMVPIGAATIAVVVGMSLMMHFARFDLKFPESALTFIVVNLFFTVIAEEAFFRGFIQERLYSAFKSPRWNNVLAVSVSALLFGLAHIGGGLRYTLLATVAGLGYALVYHRSRRIEGAIAAHYLLNIAHFLVLSYPYLQ